MNQRKRRFDQRRSASANAFKTHAKNASKSFTAPAACQRFPRGRERGTEFALKLCESF
jgi:hypothetical protein